MPGPFAWLSDPAVARIAAVLGYPGVDVRFVGGCVRDSLISRPLGDIDLGTPETPDAVTARLERGGLKAIPTGLDHGTVTAVIGPRRFEITTLRRDTSCDGRHAAVEFTTDWKEDARRRDFTINAMSVTPDGAVSDYFGGAVDLKAGIVRFVGAPADRIKEDYLRILRLFRFQAHYGLAVIDTPTLRACGELKAGLKRLSIERITQEIVKLLQAPDPAPSVAAMAACGVLDVVLPGTERDNLERLMLPEKEFSIAPSWRRRLAALGGAVQLRLSNHDADYVSAVQKKPADIALELYRDGRDIVLDRRLIAGRRDEIAQALAYVHQPMPLSGNDLLAAGRPPGPALGRSLRAAEEAWVRSRFLATRSELLDCALKNEAAPEG
jgi:poly(A) polymerase